MSTLEIDVGDLRATSVDFTATELIVTLADGRKIVTPLDWYPRLKQASDEERANYEIMPHATRRRIARALAMLRHKHVEMPARKHDNLPL